MNKLSKAILISIFAFSLLLFLYSCKRMPCPAENEPSKTLPEKVVSLHSAV